MPNAETVAYATLTSVGSQVSDDTYDVVGREFVHTLAVVVDSAAELARM